jgi:hypothetical protein
MIVGCIDGLGTYLASKRKALIIKKRIKAGITTSRISRKTLFPSTTIASMVSRISCACRVYGNYVYGNYVYGNYVYGNY